MKNMRTYPPSHLIVLMTVLSVSPFFYSTADITDGQQAFWQFDETSGVFTDSSSNNYEGIPIGDPHGNGLNGIAGGALDLDGATDAVSAGTEVGGYAVTNMFSVSFWVDLNTIGDNFYSFAGKRVKDSNVSYNAGWSIRNGAPGTRKKIRFQWFSNDGSGAEDARAKNSDGNHLDADAGWQHIVVTHDGSADLSGSVIYVDGLPVNSSITGGEGPLPGNTVATGEPFTIGQRLDTPLGFVNGQMDELRLWNRVLTEQEVWDLYIAGGGNTATITVNCADVMDTPQLWGTVNVSRRAVPPAELGARVQQEFGQPEVTRAWLMLDQMWDYRSNTYRFNYEINYDYYVGDTNKTIYGISGDTTGVHYYDYIDMVSESSETLLLNIRRYEPDVLKGLISFEQWKEVFKNGVRHYKERCPNLRYIEVSNEPTAINQGNCGTLENYYLFYMRAYEAINELNAEENYDLPLLVGGPAAFRLTEPTHVIELFGSDTNSTKRMDFVSFHHYWVEKPSDLAEWESTIDQALAQEGMSTDKPVFVTEIGSVLGVSDQEERNLWQACAMTAYQYQVRHAEDLRLFPWVQYHSPAQIAFVQFDMNLNLTPYGAAVKMLRMHRAHEVVSVSSDPEGDGSGLGSLVTMDNAGLTIHLWNYQPDGSTVINAEVSVNNIPAGLTNLPMRVRKYLIDSMHSNVFTDPAATNGLELVEEQILVNIMELDCSSSLEPMALCLWTADIIDYDGDGIADALDTDDDNDGMTDIDEAIAGTDALNENSVFKISAFDHSASDSEIKFRSVTGRVYDVLFKHDLLSTDDWLVLTNDWVGNGELLTLTNSATGTRGFYLLRVKHP